MYKLIFNVVNDPIFTNKIDFDEDGKYIDSENSSEIYYHLGIWDELIKLFTSDSVISSHSTRVYRAINLGYTSIEELYDDPSLLDHPLPFSTTWKTDFFKTSAWNNDKYLLEIELGLSDPFITLSHPSFEGDISRLNQIGDTFESVSDEQLNNIVSQEYKRGRKYSEIFHELKHKYISLINQNQFEVVLSPCKFEITGRYQIIVGPNEFTVLRVRPTYLNEEERNEIIDNLLERGRSKEMMGETKEMMGETKEMNLSLSSFFN